ncbi:MAG: hypothetical protein JWL77_6452 [Chthonomonadaceae bacterium]|nr:hypothetical protein [Chthonomonadaceae bacterium]
MGELVSIVYKPQDAPSREGSYTRLPLQEARLVVGKGIEGDLKGTNEARQLNIMAVSAVMDLAGEGFRADPGSLGEQLLLSDIDIDSLPAGTRLRIGQSACVEITEPRTGCGKFEQYQGKQRKEASGRLGQMARVVAEGIIRVGDTVHVLASTGVI